MRCSSSSRDSGRLSGYAADGSLVGALFIGIGAGLCVRAGGAPSGDDALAMSICRVTKERYPGSPYLPATLLVLALSLILSGSEAHRRIPFNGGAVGPADRIRSECAGAPGGGIKQAERTTAWIFSPSTQNFSSLWVLGGFFCSGIQSLCIFLIFMKKIQEIRAWEKKDTDVLREGTENYRSETKIAQAVRPGRFLPVGGLFFISTSTLAAPVHNRRRSR